MSDVIADDDMTVRLRAPQAASPTSKIDEQLARLRANIGAAPQDHGLHHAYSEALHKAGRAPLAAEHYSAMADMFPQDAWFARAAGHWLNMAGQFNRAIQHLLRAVALAPNDAEVFQQLAQATDSLGMHERAAMLGAKAYQLDNRNLHRALFAAHLLTKNNQLVDAINLLRRAAHSTEPSPLLYQTLTSLLTQAGDISGALAEIEQAIKLDPNQAEYHIQRSSFLLTLGRFPEAVEAIDASLHLDPNNHSIRRHKVSILLNQGDVTQALVTAAELLQHVPDHDEYASCMQHVLSQRMATQAEVSAILAEKRSRIAEPRRPYAPNLLDAALMQGRVIGALLLRETRTRFGDSKLGYLWVLVEMIIHIGFLAIVFQFTMHGKPPIGDSFFLFYFTGLIPYLLFVHTSEQLGHAIQQNKSMLQLPMVTNLNAIVARGLLELITELLVAIIFIAGFVAFGVDALPHDLGAAAGAIITAWLLGMGVGTINAVINVFSHAWHHFWGGIQRLLYFCSGIFYVPGLMPEWVREIFAWNPLFHCIDWFRTAFFYGYQPPWLDTFYPLVCSLVIIAIGLALEAALRRPLRQRQ